MLFDLETAVADILNDKEAPPVQGHEGATAVQPISPHGQSCAGNPLTWTGRVVSLDEWRRLNKWERHGSTGMLWDGRKRQ